MTPTNHKALSKFLSYVLRHHPEEIGMELDENGWVPVDLLLQQLQPKFPGTDRAVLEKLVEQNSKKRFAFDETGTKIRASQAHSVSVALGYEPQEPPMVLFHGTAASAVKMIMEEGLTKQQRHHVHLSQSVTAALQVGSRYGSPKVLKIHSGKMHEAGYAFFMSPNGVWLTDHVPPGFIEDDF